MRAASFIAFLLLISATLFTGCKKQLEQIEGDDPADYYPLQKGKYIVYRLDSTVFTNLGRTREVHVYQERHEVDAQITDNLGRPAYRVFRYLRDSAGTKMWQPAGTYMVTALQNAVEVLDDNRRTIKLFAPLKPDNSAKLNRYLPAEPYNDRYSFSNDDNMADWDFTVIAAGETLTLNGKTFNDVLTVQGIDESLNVPVTDPRSYAARSYFVEKYAKGIGPVYHEFILWEYQPNTSGGSPYTIGFGVRRSVIDYN